jgi:hypothetical protein
MVRSPDSPDGYRDRWSLVRAGRAHSDNQALAYYVGAFLVYECVFCACIKGFLQEDLISFLITKTKNRMIRTLIFNCNSGSLRFKGELEPFGKHILSKRMTNGKDSLLMTIYDNY